MVPRNLCYQKLALWDFTTGTVNDQIGTLHLLSESATNPDVVAGANGGIVFNKVNRDQYLVTPFMQQQDMTDVTLEVWATVPDEEGVGNVAVGRTRNIT